MTPRSVRRSAAALAALMLVAQSLAQSAPSSSVSPADEYGRKRPVAPVVQPDGDTPFGEVIDAYDGAMRWSQVDVSLPGAGSGPVMEVRRSFQIPDVPLSRSLRPALNSAMADWTLDIPRLDTLSAPLDGGTAWFFTDDAQRCTHFAAAPDAGGLGASDWWHGYRLGIDGQERTVLARTSASPRAPELVGPNGPIVFRGLTTDGWALGCTPRNWRGEASEGFVAVSPTGTQYWLDRMVTHGADAMNRGDGTLLARRSVSMLPSKIVDRFGNAVQYAYDDNNNLISMVGPQGRIAFTYEAWLSPAGEQAWRVSTVDVQATGAIRSLWSYQYATRNGVPRLVQVLRPDSMSWTFNLDMINSPLADGTSLYQGCDYIGATSSAATSTAGITNPDGLAATYTFRTTVHGNAAVPRMCTTNAAGSPTISMPHAYRQASLVDKTYSGTGITSARWNYVYSAASPSWADDCTGSCADRVWTDVIDPTYSTTRYTFSNRFDATDRQLLTMGRYSGSAGAGTPLRLQTWVYATSDAGPWPARLGTSQQTLLNTAALETLTPVTSRTTQQDGDTFVFAASEFDALARPARTVRSNSAYGQTAADVRVERFDDYAHGVMGQPLRRVNVTTGVEIDRSVYGDAATGMPTEQWRFGHRVASYGYDGAGHLAKVTDGNGNITTFQSLQGNVLGQITSRPDGTTESRTVDGYGHVLATVAPDGVTTSYGYGSSQQLASVQQMGSDGTQGVSTTIRSELAGSSGAISGTHWRRTESGTNGTVATDFNAMMQPLQIVGADNASTVFRYDGAGRKVFESYRLQGVGTGMVSQGTSFTYDGLGRIVQQSRTQSSQGSMQTLTTTTRWPGQLRKEVTDPRGVVSSTVYQAFDTPAYDIVIALMSGSGPSIHRDIYGYPLDVSGQTPLRQFTYDAFHRLCRTWSPERGSEIVGYDDADNVVWSVAGSAFNGTGCGQDQVTASSRTLRSYDAMNRLTSIVYPSGTDPSTFTYDAAGRLASASTGRIAWTYGHDSLGRRTNATLAADGYVWPFRYDYTTGGALTAITYPDGVTVPYMPDVMGRPTQVGTYARSIAWLPEGSPATFQFGNGATYMAQKDPGTPLRNESIGTSGVLAMSRDYQYDTSGNVTAINDLSGGGQGSRSMVYDFQNHLMRVSGDSASSEAFTYDALERMATSTVGNVQTSYSYDSRNTLVSSSGGSVSHRYQYDPRGNPMLRDNVPLTFDAADHLLSIPGKATYTYDAAGLRARSVTPAGTLYHAYDEAGHLLWEYDPATTQGTKYIYLGNRLIAFAKGSAAHVIGHVDGVVTSGADAWLQGWACATGVAGSINVTVYAGDPAANGVSLGTSAANVSSEPALQASCQANGTAWRFSVLFDEARRAQLPGRPLFVQGMHPAGGDNALLDGSGSVAMPGPSTVPANQSVVATTVTNANAVDLRWAAVARATRYEVAFIQSGQRTVLTTNAGAGFFASNLPDGTYTFEVKPCGNGCGNVFVTVPVTLAHPAGVPVMPSAPNVSSNAATASISWNAVPTATTYQLDQILGGAVTSLYSGAGRTTTATVTATGAYWYRLRACNAAGCGVYVLRGPINLTVAAKGSK